MPATTHTIKSVFLAALDKSSPEDRAAYLLETCGADAELRSRIEELLRAHESGSFPDFLTEAAPAFDATLSIASTPMDATQTRLGEEGFTASLPFLLPPREAGHLGRLDHYEVHSIIGQGGMGVVLKAFDESLDRIVAIKVLGAQYAANGTARKRFIREAKNVAAVVHDHVVSIHAVDERVPYLVMQLVQGISLQDRIDETGPMQVNEILRIGTQIASGLAAAHRSGVVHRDIKPSNILLENGLERVKITDFGLARAVDDASVTQSGVIAGTPMYMSPEQARGEPVDPRSDLFSLGSVLYAMCTGHAPFRASGTMAVMKRVIEDSPRSICEVNADIPDWLEAIVFKLLAKKPEERFENAKDVATLLEQHLAHIQQPSTVAMPARVEPVRRRARTSPPPRKRRAWLIPLVVSAVLMVICVPVLLIGGLYLFWVSGSDGPPQSPPKSFAGPAGPSDALAVAPAGRGEENLKVVLDNVALLLDLESEEGTHSQPTIESLESAYKMPPGRYHVRAYRGPKPFTLVFQKLVTLKDGELQTLRVDSVWTQLFNGKDVKGWKVFPADRSSWTVKDGTLTGKGSPSHLFSERGDYRNFHLRMETRVNKSGACGHFTRVPFGDPGILLSPYGDQNLYKKPVPKLYTKEAQALDPGKPNYRPQALSVWGVGVGEADPTATKTVPENEWFVHELIVDGNSIYVKTPGYSHSIPNWPGASPAGHLALQLFDPDSVVEYRKIEIKELPAANRDEDRLQGTWRAVQAEYAGAASTPKELTSVTVTFAGERMNVTFADGTKGEGTFTLNPTASPKQITVKAITENNQAMEGIYQFEGERLNLCIGGGSDSRPTEFISKSGSKTFRVTLERDRAVAKNTPFELTPPKVLEHMQGLWSIEVTQKIEQGMPTKHVGRVLIEPVAGGRFVIMRTLTDNGGPNELQLLEFDRNSWESRGMYFDPTGTVRGPSVGRFNAATRTLTAVSQPEDGVVRVRNTRFPDADTIEFDVAFVDKGGRTILDRRASMKRLKGHAEIAESEAAEVPKEMSLLDRLVGTWDVDMSSRIRPGDKWKTEMTGRKVLGGRFIETRERILPTGEENYTLFTYDAKKGAYYHWYVSSRWPQAEGTGVWLEAAKTLIWSCEGGAGTDSPITTSLVWKFVSADKTAFRVIVTDKKKETLEDLEGSQVRRPVKK
jgi:uncharacterized protein (TIGR03067 family)